jgi:hypothetical protein
MSKPVVLVAKSSCKLCHGTGTFWENHGQGLKEQVDCDCPFEDIPDVWEIQNKVDSGDYIIVPAAKHFNEPSE